MLESLDEIFRSLVGHVPDLVIATVVFAGTCVVVGALDVAGIEIPFPDGTLTFKEPLSLAAAHASRPAQRRAGENGPPA